MEIAIIGGGAAGMMAALSASCAQKNNVVVLERQARVGRKLLATGNGRCNLSNQNTALSFYHGQQRSFAKYALEAFGPEQTLDFFRCLGLYSRTEPSGRVYPFSDSANSVVDVLRLHLESRPNVQLLCSNEVTKLTKKRRFFLETSATTLQADRVIVTAGGVAGGKLGGSNGGYQLLKQMGHTCTKLYPSLVQIKTDPTYPKSLKGVRADAVVTLYQGETAVASETGEIQFTEFGISGPTAFSLSRHAALAGLNASLTLDLMPELQLCQIAAALSQRRQAFGQLPAEQLLTGMLHNRLGRTILRYAGYALTQPIANFSPTDFSNIAAAVKCMRLPVSGTMGMDAAQVTAGGICTREFDEQTMESKLVPGLYAAGEVLDIDGDCGGFNLQWAWSSGHLAGLLTHRE